MNKMRLISTILKMQIKDQIMYPDRLLISLISMLIRCGVLLLLYHYVYEMKNGVIAGVEYKIAMWSMFLYFPMMVFDLRSISRSMMQDVYSGNIEVLFARPISYVFYKSWMQIGSGLYPLIINSIVGALILYWTVGLPETMLTGLFWWSLPVTFIDLTIMSILIYGIVGLSAFWIENIRPLNLIIDKLIMVLGGSYLPVAMFPELLKKIAIYSPFGSSYFITHTVYVTWQNDWQWMIGWQWIWIVILSGMFYWLYQRAGRKLSINGG